MDNSTPEVFTLIGDIVGSRGIEDRLSLQAQVDDALLRANAMLEPKVEFQATIGDEFQACFGDIGEATLASLVVRLELLRGAEVDSRYGLGVGRVEVFAKSRGFSQDGPGWWAARQAIEDARGMADAPHTSFVRTCFSASESRSPRWEGEGAALNAFLLCRDAIVHRMTQPNRNRLLGLMHGWSQARIAGAEGKTQGAISQSLGRSGAFAILAAQRKLEERYR